MGGHDEADLGHLPASVGTGFVVHDDDVVEQQDPGPNGCAGPPGELLGPLQGAAAELEAVEVDAAEPEHRRAEHVAQRPRLLFDHAVRGEGAQDPVHRGVGQVDAGGEVAEAEAAGGLERQQDSDRSVDALDHGAVFLEEIS